MELMDKDTKNSAKQQSVSTNARGRNVSETCEPNSSDVQAALDRAASKKDQEHIFYQTTISTCPTCVKMVSGQILLKNGQVWMHKSCPEHGKFEVLLASDAAWWLRALTQTKPGTIPLSHATQRQTRCPEDCGLCEEHQQHTCYPLIEVTDRCDLSCPICFASNLQKFDITPEQLKFCLDRIYETEGRVECLSFTGGEATLHPQFFELLSMTLKHPAVEQVAVNTHGHKFAKDEEFCRRFAETKAIAQVQFDGSSPETYRRLRGVDLSSMKRRALDNLAKYNITTTLVTTVAAGLNEDAVQEMIKLVLGNRHIMGGTLQPVAYCGDALKNELEHDFGTHMNLTALLGLIEKQMGGAITKEDFVSIPCSHPSCSAAGYFLNAGQGEWVSLARITGADKMLDYMANRIFGKSDEIVTELQKKLPHLEALWSASAVPNSKKVTQAVSCCSAAYARTKSILGEGATKMIALHGFMDPSTYDQARAMKCCLHFVTLDGRSVPFCNYNLFHRQKVMEARLVRK